jgi:hypothetical protein
VAFTTKRCLVFHGCAHMDSPKSSMTVAAEKKNIFLALLKTAGIGNPLKKPKKFAYFHNADHGVLSQLSNRKGKLIGMRLMLKNDDTSAFNSTRASFAVAFAYSCYTR